MNSASEVNNTSWPSFQGCRGKTMVGYMHDYKEGNEDFLLRHVLRSAKVRSDGEGKIVPVQILIT